MLIPGYLAMVKMDNGKKDYLPYVKKAIESSQYYRQCMGISTDCSEQFVADNYLMQHHQQTT